jgi:hypothetical protein
MPDNTSTARVFINQHTYFLSGVDTEALGKRVAQQCLSYFLVVNEVFDQLSSLEDKVWTGFYMIKSLEDVGLYKLANYREGNSLLNAIGKWLFNSPRSLTGNHVNDFRTVRQRISVAIRNSGKLVSYQPSGARKLFDYEIPPNGNKAICWELGEEGVGFKTFNRNDVLVDGLDQVGTEGTINVIMYLAKVWTTANRGVWLEIGDISRAGGLDTSEHDTHEDGKEFDVRFLRNDGGYGSPIVLAEGTFSNPMYHRDHTKNFIRLVNKEYPGSIVYINDENITTLDEFKRYVFTYPGHFNHFHIILPGGQRKTKLEGQLVDPEKKKSWW